MSERSECSLSEDDVNYLTAATINLYHESIRRDGRDILAPQDVPVLYELIEVITHPVQITIVPREARPLSEAEQEQILRGEAPALEPLPPGEYVLEITLDGGAQVAEGPFKGRSVALSAFKGRHPGAGRWTATIEQRSEVDNTGDYIEPELPRSLRRLATA